MGRKKAEDQTIFQRHGIPWPTEQSFTKENMSEFHEIFLQTVTALIAEAEQAERFAKFKTRLLSFEILLL